MHEMKTKKKDVFASNVASGFRKKKRNNTKAPILKGNAFLNKERSLLPNAFFKCFQPLKEWWKMK